MYAENYRYRSGLMPLALSVPSARMLESIRKSDLSSTASISASSMTSTPSSARSFQSRMTTAPNENKICRHYNGLKSSKKLRKLRNGRMLPSIWQGQPAPC
jgi:hypothetical protein